MSPDAWRPRCRPALSNRTMDLFGLDAAGQPRLWQRAALVQSIDRFPRLAGEIVPGLYVLMSGLRAAAAHVSRSPQPGSVAMQIMCRDLAAVTMFQQEAEANVLGLVVPDKRAEIEAVLRRAFDGLAERRASRSRRGAP